MVNDVYNGLNMLRTICKYVSNILKGSLTSGKCETGGRATYLRTGTGPDRLYGALVSEPLSLSLSLNIVSIGSVVVVVIVVIVVVVAAS